MLCFTRLRNVLVAVCLVSLLGVNVVYAADDLPNTPPSDPPWYGGYYITGVAADLGDCTIYLPVNEGWCLDEYGYLFRYASSSASGKLYTENGTIYDFNAQAFSTPRYRLSSSSSYSYTDLHFYPTASNVVVEDSFEMTMDVGNVYTLALIAVVGLIFIVLISRGRG